MGLTIYDIKRILRPKRDRTVADDFRMIDSWAIFKDGSDVNKRNLDYLCYELETIDPETGEKYHFYKALKFLRVIRLPKDAKQSTSFMDKHTQVLTSVWEQGINLVTVIANIIKPEPIGLLYLYGVQGVALTLDEAKRQAHDAYIGFRAAMQGTYRVLEMRCINAQETEWLREKMYNMDYMTVVRGIPKANQAGEDAGNKGVGGKNLNPDSQGTLEEIISGMVDYEYVIQILSTPVYMNTLREWSRRTERAMTDWNSQLQGTKAFSFNIALPMTFGASQNSSQGWNKAYTDANSVNYSHGESFNTSFGENVGQSLSQSFGQSFGQTHGVSQTDTYSMSHGMTQGVTMGQTVGHTQGISSSHGVSQGQSYSQAIGQSFGTSNGTSFGSSLNNSTSNGTSLNHSDGSSFGQSFGTSNGSSHNTSMGNSLGQTFGTSRGSSHNMSAGNSLGNTFGLTRGTSQNVSEGISSGKTYGTSEGTSHSVTDGTSSGVTKGTSFGTSHNVTDGTSSGQTIGNSYGTSQNWSNGTSHSSSFNKGINESVNDSVSHSTGTSVGDSTGYSRGESHSMSEGESFSNSRSHGTSTNDGRSGGTSGSESNGYNDSAGLNLNNSAGITDTGSGLMTGQANVNVLGVPINQQSHSDSLSSQTGLSFNSGDNHALSDGWNDGWSHSSGTSDSSGFTRGSSTSVSDGVSSSESVSHSTSNSFSDSTSHGTSLGTSESYGYSDGTTMSEGWGVNESTSTSQNIGQSHSDSWGTSTSYSDSQNFGQSHSDSWGTNNSISESQNYGNSYSQGWGISDSMSQSQNVGQSYSEGWGSSDSVSESQNTGQSFSEGWGTSDSTSMSENTGTSMSDGYGSSASFSAGQGTNEGTSYSTNLGNSVTESYSQTYSVSNTVGTSESISQSESLSKSQSESYTTSEGQSVGNSYSESSTQNVSNGQTQSYGTSKSVGQGDSYSEGTGRSQSMSTGASGAYVSGTSSSMGLSGGIGYNKSYQWLDQQVKDILELLEFKNERFKRALRGCGMFYTYVYIACPSQDALSAAMTVAKSTWQNEFAMTNPLQVLDLNDEEQQSLLYHFAAFSTDVTREPVYGEYDYKYATALLPSEFTAYSHLPRISEGGIYTEVNDVPKFSVPAMKSGEIYMGKVLSAERFSAEQGYETPFDYRLDESELMHGFFTGASRSGKTVAAMRFVAELSRVRRKKTGKRMRIVCMDPKQDWRTLARYVEPDRFNFYSLGKRDFCPIHLNPLKIPKGVEPQFWIDGLIDIYCRAYGLLERGKQMMGETIYALYKEAGVFEARERLKDEDWATEVTERSKKVTFRNVYLHMEKIKAQLEDPSNPKGKAGNDTRDAYARLLDRLQAFNRDFAIEYQLFGTEEGIGVDDLIGADDVTVLESKGLEKTFRNFIFGIITSGFYKYAIAHEGGFLSKDQYETLLVIEEANEVLTGNDAAGSGGGASMGLTVSGQSEFEEILDQSAGYGLFIIAITQKIAEMPSSIIANSGLVFAGKLKRPDDVNTVIRAVAREERYEDRDLVKWFPRSPIGWFVCQSSRTYDFKDMEPVLIHVARLNVNPPSNQEIYEILSMKKKIDKTA